MLTRERVLASFALTSLGGDPEHYVEYAEEATDRILRGVPWQQKQLDSFVLMLCQDGSVGLALLLWGLT